MNAEPGFSITKWIRTPENIPAQTVVTMVNNIFEEVFEQELKIQLQQNMILTTLDLCRKNKELRAMIIEELQKMEGETWLKGG